MKQRKSSLRIKGGTDFVAAVSSFSSLVIGRSQLSDAPEVRRFSCPAQFNHNTPLSCIFWHRHIRDSHQEVIGQKTISQTNLTPFTNELFLERIGLTFWEICLLAVFSGKNIGSTYLLSQNEAGENRCVTSLRLAYCSLASLHLANS